jgi:hypothetical protein
MKLTTHVSGMKCYRCLRNRPTQQRPPRERHQRQEQLLELLLVEGNGYEADQRNRAHRQRAADDPRESVQGDWLAQCCRPATLREDSRHGRSQSAP